MSEIPKALTPRQELVQGIHELYNYSITEREAFEAAENLIGFCKTLLAIKKEIAQNQGHDQRD